MKFVIEHLSKSFEKKEVLRDIDFTFDEGKIYGLLGRNGAGKTTLFNCLNRDIKTDNGNFYIDTDGVRREVTADDIGYVLSTPTVPEFLTGREFLKFFMDINEKSIKNPKSIDEYFDYMSIEPEDRDKLLKDYSHGMKNKISYPIVTDEIKEVSSQEDIELSLKLTGFLKYDLFENADCSEDPLITITYHLKDGTDKVIAANNTTVWWNEKTYAIKDKEMFINLTEGIFFLEDLAE